MEGGEKGNRECTDAGIQCSARPKGRHTNGIFTGEMIPPRDLGRQGILTLVSSQRKTDDLHAETHLNVS